MSREKNETIYTQGFASLILDYEFTDYVSCRVLVEDLYRGRIHAKDREEAIAAFRAEKW